MTKKKVSNTKRNKTVKAANKEKAPSQAVKTEPVEAEVQSLEENEAKNASTENAEKTETAETGEKAAAKETVAEKPVTKEPLKAETVEETVAEKPAAKKTPVKKTTAKKAAQEEPKTEEPAAEEPMSEQPMAEEPVAEVCTTPRRSVAFIGSECYPFVKTGGLGDVMYALPKALIRQNCDVKVILPRYKCIPQEYQEKMVYKGSFQMDLCADGRSFYVGIMEYVWDGVVYDFIDNEEFFTNGNPYTNLIDDIPKYCYFAKAALAALNYMDWIPDIIHCHDWQAALVPVYLRVKFADTKLTSAKTILTIHNLRFQGVYNIPTIRYWSGLPDYVFNKDALKTGYEDANMLKGG
ncbi:MAG: glycogen/starch synthase, partial [Lachnospiraceae bacterium]|nr:glycogen/starch synthase [Lachnospiraceae bacterium]